MKPKKIGAGIVIIKDDKVLLVKHGPAASHLNDASGLPCGTVKEGETNLQTAKREFFEETGLEAKKIESFPNNYYEAIIEFKDGSKKLASMELFYCSEYEGQLRANEETTPFWIKINELKSQNLLPNVQNAVIAVQKFLKLKKPKISLIAAVAKNNVIGNTKSNSLLWHIPEDFKHFKNITAGHAVIMGSRTFESIGKPLPNRTNIVISSKPDDKAQGCIVVHSVDEAVGAADSPRQTKFLS